ncbi:EIICBA-Glc [Leclercia adecarboxylata]|uniref:EIICBA-Glc n=1 Tax=Leclercia adecarboxylata TaxID=83655 RepID=A0A4U9HUM7_9ENTR|nr:EIICBA-Glc [Leclercia adecarboxylata]
MITLIPFLGNPVLQAVFIWMSKVGSFAFSFLPVMFCIAIPLGLARENKGVAAFAGFVGYAVMNLAVQLLAHCQRHPADHRCGSTQGQQHTERDWYSVY